MKALERGNKLWEGHRMILPEHEEELWRERKKKEEYRPPELDPDALEEIARMIQWSMTEEEPVEITYASRYGPKTYIGHVVRIDPVERWLIMRNGREKEMIPFSIILGAGEPPEDD